MSNLRKAAHTVFRIHLHIVLVTKYRKKVLTQAMLDDLKEIFSGVLEPHDCNLLECEGEPDHVHLLVDLHPDNNISNLVGSLKSASSRVLRHRYPEEIKKFYWGKHVRLWHDAKCIISAGGAPLEVLKDYIRNQGGGREA